MSTHDDPTCPVCHAGTTEPTADDTTDLPGEVHRWFLFLRDRAAEAWTPRGNLMVGYAYSRATTAIECDRPGLAVRQLRWLIAESEQFRRHPDYPGKTAAT